MAFAATWFIGPQPPDCGAGVYLAPPGTAFIAARTPEVRLIDAPRLGDPEKGTHATAQVPGLPPAVQMMIEPVRTMITSPVRNVPETGAVPEAIAPTKRHPAVAPVRPVTENAGKPAMKLAVTFAWVAPLLFCH